MTQFLVLSASGRTVYRAAQRRLPPSSDALLSQTGQRLNKVCAAHDANDFSIAYNGNSFDAILLKYSGYLIKRCVRFSATTSRVMMPFTLRECDRTNSSARPRFVLKASSHHDRVLSGANFGSSDKVAFADNPDKATVLVGKGYSTDAVSQQTLGNIIHAGIRTHDNDIRHHHIRSIYRVNSLFPTAGVIRKSVSFDLHHLAQRKTGPSRTTPYGEEPYQKSMSNITKLYQCAISTGTGILFSITRVAPPENESSKPRMTVPTHDYEGGSKSFDFMQDSLCNISLMSLREFRD